MRNAVSSASSMSINNQKPLEACMSTYKIFLGETSGEPAGGGITGWNVLKTVGRCRFAEWSIYCRLQAGLPAGR
jgi:hypothetical protein